MIINDNSVQTIRELARKKVEIRVVTDIPTELTEAFTVLFNRENQTLYLCDTTKWIKFEGAIL